MTLALLSAASRLRVRPGPLGGGGGGNLRTFSTPEWAFLLGPQVVPGTYEATGITNMESNLTSRASEFVTRCTSVEGFVAESGTIAVTNGSADIVGTGTTFTGKTGRGIRIPDAGFGNGYRYFLIHSVQSATTAKLGVYSSGAGSVQTVNYGGSTESGLAWATGNTASDGSGNSVDDFNAVYNYYDTVLGLYQGWAKVDNMDGGSSVLTAARDIADHLADTTTLGGWALPSGGAVNTSPRTAAMIGFACRAYDANRSYQFDAMARYVDSMAYWITNEATGGARASNPELYSVRDEAYVQMFRAVLGAVHPNSTTRDAFYTASVASALDPLIRKKSVLPNSGGWRWFKSAEGTLLTESDGTTPAIFSQPFLMALLIESLIWTHRGMRKRGVTSGTAYDDISEAIVEGVRGWYKAYQQASNGFNANIRALSYFTGTSGQKVNGTTALVDVDPPGGTFALEQTTLPGNPTYPTDWDKITEARQLNADGLGNIGYAHALSPGSEFLDMYHEVLASCFEFRAAPSTTYASRWAGAADGSAFTDSQKNWNQHHRLCQRAPAWIVGGLETF